MQFSEKGEAVNIQEAYEHLTSLCQKALGTTSPNPNVAAAIYSSSGALIADGFHNRLISPDHAEVVAINKAGAASIGSTMVLSLEPCAHTGATPPCTQAIIEAGISRVIYAVKDPNQIASGGAAILMSAGIEVEFISSPQLQFAQRAWLHKIRTGLPLMIWKIATTLDGKVAASDGSSKWISHENSRADVQLIRSQSDAILVGSQTAAIDNPHLIPRGYSNRPTRIICGESELPATHNVFDEQARTLFIKSRSLPQIMEVLVNEGFNQVLVEAGATLGTALLREEMIDELVHYQAPALLGSGRSFVEDLGISTINQRMNLELLEVEEISGDIKSHYAVKGSR